MKSRLPFILVALVTASITYAALNYSGGSKSPATGPDYCCDPTTETAK